MRTKTHKKKSAARQLADRLANMHAAGFRDGLEAASIELGAWVFANVGGELGERLRDALLSGALLEWELGAPPGLPAPKKRSRRRQFVQLPLFDRT